MATDQNPPPPKTPKPADPQIDQLLREAVAAMKMGDKDSARTRLQQVVALDQYNERGWFMLAQVVETDDERRVCLGNVMLINPKNDKAKIMLDQLSGNPNAGLILNTEDSTEAKPAAAGSSGNRRVLIIGGALVAVVLVLVIAFLVLGKQATPPVVPTVAVL